MREKSISLQSILASLGRHWVLICVITLLFGTAGARYRYRKLLPQTKQVQTENTTESASVSKSAAQFSDNQETIQQQIEYESAYVESTVLAKLNPYAVGKAYADLAVTIDSSDASAEDDSAQDEGNTDETESAAEPVEGSDIEEVVVNPLLANASDTENQSGVLIALSADDAMKLHILRGYRNLILHGIDLSGTAEELGVTEELLKELISADLSDDGTLVLEIVVTYIDEEGASKILDAVLDGITEYRDRISEENAEHSVSVLNRSSDVRVDTSMFAWVNRRLAEMNTMMNTLDTFKTASSALGSSSAITTTVQTMSRRTLMKQTVKYGLAGLVGGFLLCFVFGALILIFSDRVLNAEDFNHQYGLYKLCAVADPKILKLHGPGRWFSGKVRREYSGTSEAVCYEIAGENLAAVSDSSDVIGIVGDVDTQKMQTIREKLEAASGIGGRSLVALPELLTSPEDLKKLKDVECVILAAETGRTQYRRTDAVLETAAHYGKKVIGSIVI